MQNKICVYAICKNEAKFIDTWLDNMSEADYIVVLDTGSTDGTYERLKEDPRITRVEQQEIVPWRFDVARNLSMTLIPDDANILLCTDFDELFNTGWADSVRAKWTEGVDRGNYKYAWSHTSIGEPSDVFIYDKMHSRDYTWKFPVHEVLEPVDDSFKSNIVQFSEEEVFLQHYPDNLKSRSFYFDLLKLSVEENPNDPHVSMLLAREYLINNRTREALDAYLATLEMPEIDDPYYRQVLLESLGRCAGCYAELDDYDEAMWYCHEWIKEDPTYREPYFMLGEMFNNMHMYTLGEAMAKAGFEYGLRKYDWLERKPAWNEWGYEILVISQGNLGKIDDAIISAKKALEYDPTNVHMLSNYNKLLESKLHSTQV